MGVPECRADPGEDELPTAPTQHAPMPSSDDSDNESTNNYEGYQPLALAADDDEMAIEDSEDMDIEDQISENVPPVDNLPHVETVNAEVEREVWSEPRPQELQIEMDPATTNQILNAMANFTLPNISVPDWAAGVPEEAWKEELLQRIRQRKTKNDQVV